MVFSSILFLFRFMPAAFAIYYLVPKRFKNFTLLVLSLIFYSWGEAKYFPVMIASIVVDYTASGLIESHRDNKLICRLGLIYSVVFNLGMLGFFKYTNFFVGNLNALFGLSLPTISFVLPLGISFYTFQTMSYTIDVYLGKVKAERNIIDFGAFVVLFPQLIAGPIVRYTDINRELKERQINLPKIQDGIKLFILGLGSKVLIANNVGALWTEIEAIGAGEGFLSISTPLAWMAVFAYSLQIYFDFSGYSLSGHRPRQDAGLRIPQELRFPLHLPQLYGVLAALAHDPRLLVPGVSVYSPGRQPRQQAAALFTTFLWCGQPPASGMAPAGILYFGACSSSSFW